MRNKTLNRLLIYSLFFMGALSMLLTVGCASSGSRSIATMKISESNKAISVAKEANTSTNSPVDLRNAEHKQAQANQALTDEEYMKATRLAEKATVDADYARVEAKAEEEKKQADQMRQNTSNLRQDLEQISR
jgi:hypothetical protein